MSEVWNDWPHLYMPLSSVLPGLSPNVPFTLSHIQHIRLGWPDLVALLCFFQATGNSGFALLQCIRRCNAPEIPKMPEKE